MTEKLKRPRFQGFTGPNYTQVPDELFDELLPDLSGAELKVLLYIMRRTFGFKREADAISLSQMLHGLRARDGRALDRGVGLSKKTLLQAINSLEQQGIVFTERRRSAERGDEPTTYRLNVQGVEPANTTPGVESTPPVGEKVHQGGGVLFPPGPWGKKYTTQETVEGQREGETGKDISNIRRAPPPKKREEATEGRERSGAGPPGLEAVDAVIRRRRGRPSQAEQEARQAIAAYIEDFSRELGDQAPLKSSVTRALNLMQQAGVDLETFIGVLYEARLVTKEHTASIRTTAEGGNGRFPTKNKMAYYFAVVEDCLGLRDDQDHEPAPAQPASPPSR